MANIVSVLQYHEYNKWKNAGQLDTRHTVKNVQLLAIETEIRRPYYNTTAKNFVLNPITTFDPYYMFAHFRLNYLMQFSPNVGGFTRAQSIFRIIKVNADVDSVEQDETPTPYPPYTLSKTDETMRDWMNNEALTPENNLLRCLACVMREHFGSYNETSCDAFGFYCTDKDSSHEKWLGYAKKFMQTHSQERAIEIINNSVEMYETRLTLRQLFGKFAAY